MFTSIALKLGRQSLNQYLVPRANMVSGNRKHRGKKRLNIEVKNNEPNPYENNEAKLLLDNATLCDAESPLGHTDDWQSEPYPDLDVYNQKRFNIRSRIDPTTRCIVLFPGENEIDIGKNIKVDMRYDGVKDMYEEASEALKFNLLELTENGPKDELIKMKYRQPAIFVASLAATQRLQSDFPDCISSCVGTAGYGLGEITALTFAGALTFHQGLRLVQMRGEAIDLAAEITPSVTIKVFCGAASKPGLAVNLVKDKQNELGYCIISSYLYPSCKFITGDDKAIEMIIKNKDLFNLGKIKKLRGSTSFYSALMKPAEEPLKVLLQNMNITMPEINVYSTIDSMIYGSVTSIQKKLVKQITVPIKWEQTIHKIYERPFGEEFPTTYICGPGNRKLYKSVHFINSKVSECCICVNAFI